MRPGSSPQLADRISFGLRVLDPRRQFLGGKAAEHHAVHRADPRAGQHRHHGFRHHRHIEDDAVALGDAEILHDGGERLHLMQHLRIGEFGDAARQRRIVDQRQLIGAAAGDMAVERVVAGVDHRTREPAAVEAERGIEDLLRRLDPVDLGRRLAPKPFGVGERAGMDLVITAVVLNVHGVTPGGGMPIVHLSTSYWPRHGGGQARHDDGDNRYLFDRHCHL